MCKSKIQPPTPLIRRRLQIPKFLLLAQTIPLSIPRLVPPHIVRLCEYVDENIYADENHKHAISALVPWRVIRSVDIGCDYTTGLHAHVVCGGGDSARPHSVGVS